MQYLFKIFCVFILALNGVHVFCQQKELTADHYFRSGLNEIVKPLPVVLRWVNDTQFILKKDGKSFIADARTGNEKEISAADHNNEVVQQKSIAYVSGNDLYIKINNAEVRLTSDEDKEINPTMSPDGNYVCFTKKNDLYTINILTKKQTRLTHDGSDVILNGYASWVYTEEILGRKSNYRSFWWSPDNSHIAFFRTDDSPVPVFTLTDAATQHGYLEKVRYPKAGDTNPQVRIGIIRPEGGTITWADFNEQDDQYFGAPYWKPDGRSLLVQWMNRKQNNLKIWSVNPDNGKKSLFYNEEQKTWIDLDDEGERISFLKNGEGFILFNDASGWKHMFYYDMNGRLINQVTSGNFSVTGLEFIDENNGIVYFSARGINNTATKDLYKINIDGKKLQRLTSGEYNHVINISPGGSYFITTYSNVSSPAKIALLDNQGKLIREIADSKAPDFDQYHLSKTTLIRVKSDDGLYELPMKVTWPLNIDKNKKYPVLISVYGGPDRASVTDNWTLSGAQQWYAKEGLIQVTMDHRGSGHFGKEGVNYMYHNLGYWEMKDYSAMARWLIANGNADPTKICITGFSYGGYVSCYALTYGSDIFTHGMAGGSVVDWSLYDTHYTERFMGTPEENPAGYKSSSVLTHTDKYKGMLQIVHGVLDDNVHLQNSMQLISKLQDDRKNFEFMIYSGGRHGWSGNKNLHFQNLKTNFIYRYLLEKDPPKDLLK